MRRLLTGIPLAWRQRRAGRLRVGLIAFALATGTLLAPSGAVGASHKPPPLPIVFVHGLGGTAANYASIAKRFASNGYPAERIQAFEWDSSSGAALAAAPAQLDALIDQLRARYGVGRVNLVAHSLGAAVARNYLAVPANAAKVSHYVAVDRIGDDFPSCGIGDPNLDCMGIFRGSTGDVGGNNVYFNGTQSHTEAETSPQSFAAQYRFFTGADPKTTLILPEPPSRVEIAGRAVNQPQNTGVDGGTLRIWVVNAATGARKASHPIATISLGPSGTWGPVRISGQKYYEFELLRPDTLVEEHFYYQPFLRDDYWVRLRSSPPTSPITLNTLAGPNHAAALVFRYREWWTTHPSGQEDILRIATRSPSQGDQPPVNVLQNVINDGLGLFTSPTGIQVHDNPADMVSSLDLIPFFMTQPFRTGVDVYMPANTPADGTITFWNAPRGDTSRPQVLNTPNWASDRHRITVQFNDYVQGQCRGAKVTILGTTGNDVRTGTPGRDVIAGLAGNDKLSGLAGNDLICGGAGRDTLNGGKGNDKLYGEKGKDVLRGGKGKDKLKGGKGKDKLVQ